MKYAELVEKAIEELKDNDDLFVEMVNELDGWSGFADGFRAYPMYELDDLFSGCTVREFLNKLGRDFDHNDEYMVDTIYGLESTNDIVGLYRDNVAEGELLDNIINYANHIWFSDHDFEELVNSIVDYDEDETA